MIGYIDELKVVIIFIFGKILKMDFIKKVKKIMFFNGYYYFCIFMNILLNKSIFFKYRYYVILLNIIGDKEVGWLGCKDCFMGS